MSTLKFVGGIALLMAGLFGLLAAGVALKGKMFNTQLGIGAVMGVACIVSALRVLKEHKETVDEEVAAARRRAAKRKEKEKARQARSDYDTDADDDRPRRRPSRGRQDDDDDEPPKRRRRRDDE